MADQERPFIGTQAGGSPSTLTKLADWFTGPAAYEVGSVADDLQRMLDRLLDVWDDDASKVVQWHLHQGRTGTDDLEDRLKKCGNLVTECADSLSRAQQDLPGVEQNAIDRGLEVNDHQIWHPEPPSPEDVPGQYSQAETSPHTNVVEEEYQRRAETFDITKGEAEAALFPLATALESVAEKTALWKDLVYPTASFVAGESQLLVEKYHNHVSNGSRLSYGVFDHFNNALRGPSGIVTRVLGGPTTVVITGLDAADQLQAGKRADRVLVQVGSGTLASAGVLILGVWAGAAPALIVLAMAAGGFFGGVLGSEAYENFVPRTAWEILTDNAAHDYGLRGSVNTGNILPE